MKLDRRSLEFRLVWRLVAVLASAVLVFGVVVLFQGRQIAAFRGTLNAQDRVQKLGEGEARESLADEVLEESLTTVVWLFPVGGGVILLIAIVGLRRGLKPLRRVSRQARQIGPDKPDVRLDAGQLPSELVPLVEAVNQALDRLGQGMEQQRRFTANAAHQLRTPLAILTAGLDVLEGGDDVAKLRADVARMNRLVDQLLRVARLDNVALDTTQPMDLAVVAMAEVGALAPYALQQGCDLALEAPATPVHVPGNANAIADVLRNVIENAIRHSPVSGEVVVKVQRPDRICVIDHGPGVARDQREQVFERFWRGCCDHEGGAGLGLAIARDVMCAHGGEIRISDTPGGGATFTLAFANCGH